MIYRILNRRLKIRNRLPTRIRDDPRCSGRVGSSWRMIAGAPEG